MRLILYIAIGLGIILVFQNCQEVVSPNNSDGDEIKTVKTTEANLRDANSVILVNPSGILADPSVIEYSVEFSNFTLTITNRTAGINLACNLTPELHNRLSQLVERAQICRTEYTLHADTARCQAIGTPYARVNYNTGAIELVDSECYYDAVSLCDDVDQSELISIFSDLRQKQNLFSCRQI
jgi:hypothetical protein